MTAGATVEIRRPRTRTRVVLYGIVPFIAVGALVVFYYSGVPFLRQLVSPDVAGVAPDSQREFGLLESLQNAVLLGALGVALAGLWRKRLTGERLALLFVAFVALFQLLEETDYGMHYVELVSGESAGAAPGFHNIHRIGYLQVVLQNVAQFGILTFFGAFAILFAGSRRPVLRYVAPDRWSILTILLVTAIQEVVWRVAAERPAAYGSLGGNEIEFAELGVYYLGLLYVLEMVFRRDFVPAPK